jgi:hypothetical protein
MGMWPMLVLSSTILATYNDIDDISPCVFGD